MTLRRLIVMVTALSLALMGLAAPAAAESPIDANGDWTYMPDGPGTVDKLAGNNVFLSNTAMGEWTGTLEGDVTESFVVKLHKDERGVYRGLLTFTGCVTNKCGTLQIKTNGTGPWPPPDAGDWSGSWVILSGTDDLSNLRGQGSWEGPLGNLSYSGKVHFTGK